MTRSVLRIYLAELADAAAAANLQPDALVLGCTHYPLLRAELEQMVPAGTCVIDSAEVTAEQAAAELGVPLPSDADAPRPAPRFYATDGLERFRALGSRFLGETITAVQIVDFGG